MTATPKKIFWLGWLPVLLGVNGLIYLAATADRVSSWIFAAGLVALGMIAAGGWFFYRQSRA